MELGPNDSVLKPSASMAIGSNGYKILAMPKYASKIVQTVVIRRNPDDVLCKMRWLDADGKEVAWHLGEYDPKRYPILGDVKEVYGSFSSTEE